MACFLWGKEVTTLGYRPVPSKSSAAFLPPTESLLWLLHHPHGSLLEYGGSAAGCHRPLAHCPVPHDGHNDCLRGKPPSPPTCPHEKGLWGRWGLLLDARDSGSPLRSRPHRRGVPVHAWQVREHRRRSQLEYKAGGRSRSAECKAGITS